MPISGAIAQQRKVDTIANNIANANTPGFKKDDLVFKEHLSIYNDPAAVIEMPRKEWRPEDFYKSYGAENSLVKTDGSYTNFQQGQLTPTGNPLDLAIFGKGFFEILTPNGVKYTRRGNFTIDNENKLVNDHGFPVLSSNNLDNENIQESPNSRFIKLNLTSGKIHISGNGEIFENGNLVTKLSVVEFNDRSKLKKEGAGLFTNSERSNVKKANLNSTIYQGHSEESNVNPMNEMSELIKAHRHFDSIQKAIKTYDEMSSKLNEISRF